MGAGAGSWEKAQQEGGDPLHRSDGGVGAGIRSWRRGHGGRGGGNGAGTVGQGT